MRVRDVAQDPLRMPGEQIAELVQSVADRARVSQRVIGRLSRGGDALLCLGARLSVELQRLLAGVLDDLLGLLARILAEFVRFGLGGVAYRARLVGRRL